MVTKAEMPPRLREIKDAIVDAIFKRTRSENLEEGNRKQGDFMMNTFKQWDEDLSGALSPREVVTEEAAMAARKEACRSSTE